ncbi:MAG: hypothetical protein ACJ74G_19560 [Blastocatellia bacterium]
MQGKFPMGLTITFLLIIGIISAVGIIGPLAMASDMAMRNIPPGEFLPVMILGPLVGLGIDVLLVWLLIRLVKIYYHPTSTSGAPASRTDAVKEFTPPQLSAPPASIGSVTEHTTRNFEAHEKQIRARQVSRDTNEV